MSRWCANRCAKEAWGGTRESNSAIRAHNPVPRHKACNTIGPNGQTRTDGLVFRKHSRCPLRYIGMAPSTGLEPVSCGLEDRCSSVELRRYESADGVEPSVSRTLPSNRPWRPLPDSNRCPRVCKPLPCLSGKWSCCKCGGPRVPPPAAQRVENADGNAHTLAWSVIQDLNPRVLLGRQTCYH